MTIFNVFSLLGGLALFLFGMDIMGKALEKQAGGQLQKILSKLTDNPLKGFFLGLCVTAVIQSSSATTVMVVGFVNSGIMELHQAIGVIMGSNVGTTVTSWILSLSGLQGDSLLINLLNNTIFIIHKCTNNNTLNSTTIFFFNNNILCYINKSSCHITRISSL